MTEYKVNWRPSGVLAAGAALAALIALSVPVAAQNNEEPAPEQQIIRTENAPADGEIDRRIEGILREIDGLQGVRVNVQSGVVTLAGEVAEPALRDQAEALAGRVEGVVAVRNDITELTAVSDRIAPVASRLTARLNQTISYLPLILVALIVAGLIAVAGLWIASWRWPWSRIAPNAFIADLLRQIVRLAFFIAAIVIALDIIGATALLSAILGAAGLVGLAVGFAVRDTVENYVASILLSVRQPFRPNDHIRIGEEEGHVMQLTARATVLMSLDGNHVRIPNAIVFKGIIHNFTRNPERRFEFDVGVDADSNLQQAMDVGLDTLTALDFVLDDPPPRAFIEQLGDSNIVLRFQGWVDQNKTDFARARSEAIRLTKRALDTSGVMMPEPIYRLRIEGGSVVEQRAPQQAPAAAAKPQPTESAVAADTSPDETVKQKVEEERAQTGGRDLLDDRAPQELGG